MSIKTKIRRVTALLIILSFVFAPAVKAKGNETKRTVIAGGMPFGVSFKTGEIKIGGFDEIETEGGTVSPGRDAGLKINDIIKEVCGHRITCALDVTNAVKENQSKKISVVVDRDGQEITFTVTPAVERDGSERLGIWLEDGTCGLGTVTYIEKDTGCFGGLGHGIIKGDTGHLCNISKGNVSRVTVFGVNRGEAGKPGELKGNFHPEKIGVITKNTMKGVFGYFTDLPKDFGGREMELGTANEVRDGGAVILCTVDDGGVCEYGVEITRLKDEKDSGRDFVITVTDTSLLTKTGGIVRGMSGSPVIQNGKLIGAVTHVLVGDPCRGYGILIENMMEASK